MENYTHTFGQHEEPMETTQQDQSQSPGLNMYGNNQFNGYDYSDQHLSENHNSYENFWNSKETLIGQHQFQQSLQQPQQIQQIQNSTQSRNGQPPSASSQASTDATPASSASTTPTSASAETKPYKKIAVQHRLNFPASEDNAPTILTTVPPTRQQLLESPTKKTRPSYARVTDEDSVKNIMEHIFVPNNGTQTKMTEVKGLITDICVRYKKDPVRVFELWLVVCAFFAESTYDVPTDFRFVVLLEILNVRSAHNLDWKYGFKTKFFFRICKWLRYEVKTDASVSTKALLSCLSAISMPTSLLEQYQFMKVLLHIQKKSTNDEHKELVKSILARGANSEKMLRLSSPDKAEVEKIKPEKESAEKEDEKARKLAENGSPYTNGGTTMMASVPTRPQPKPREAAKPADLKPVETAKPAGSKEPPKQSTQAKAAAAAQKAKVAMSSIHVASAKKTAAPAPSAAGDGAKSPSPAPEAVKKPVAAPAKTWSLSEYTRKKKVQANPASETKKPVVLTPAAAPTAPVPPASEPVQTAGEKRKNADGIISILKMPGSIKKRKTVKFNDNEIAQVRRFYSDMDMHRPQEDLDRVQKDEALALREAVLDLDWRDPDRIDFVSIPWMQLPYNQTVQQNTKKRGGTMLKSFEEDLTRSRSIGATVDPDPYTPLESKLAPDMDLGHATMELVSFVGRSAYRPEPVADVSLRVDYGDDDADNDESYEPVLETTPIVPQYNEKEEEEEEDDDDYEPAL